MHSQCLSICRIFALLIVIAILSPATAREQQGEVEAIQVAFETSCSDFVAQKFNHAVTMLHSFEYLETDCMFREILEQDPGCAMARWGIAMSIWHPLWGRPSIEDLKAGAAILAGTESGLVTPRESTYLAAIRAFFADANPATHLQRAGNYEREMQRLYEQYNDDSEAVVFYALSLTGNSRPTRQELRASIQSGRPAELSLCLAANTPRRPALHHSQL